MMNNAILINPLGQAIYCDCYVPILQRNKVLGSVTDTGMIEILRSHKNKTRIEAREFTITCDDCGYKRCIRIESMALKRPTTHETY